MIPYYRLVSGVCTMGILALTREIWMTMVISVEESKKLSMIQNFQTELLVLTQVRNRVRRLFQRLERKTKRKKKRNQSLSPAEAVILMIWAMNIQ